MTLSADEAYRAFWSYTHKDDQSDSGRIVQLAHDIADEYGLLTSADMNLFLDIDEIEWGAELLPSISAALSEISFFIPAITPRYFKSEPCRKELQEFHTSATALGLQELILPVLYVDVPELHEPTDSADQLVNIIKERKWFDWRELRLADRMSTEYRAGVNQMAERIRRATAVAQNANLSVDASVVTGGDPGGDGGDDDEDAELGVLDRMAQMEDFFPAFTNTLGALTNEIVEVGELTQTWSERLQTAPSLKARLVAVKKFAGILQPHGDRVLELGGQFASQLREVDFGLTTVIQQAAAEFPTAPDEDKRSVCEFFNSLRSMVEASEGGMEGIQSMADSIEQVEGMSKDIRPPLRTLRRGLLLAVDGRAVIEGWGRLIESIDIDCSDVQMPQEAAVE